jgi:release factor glutamine methyltransferase
VLTRISFDQSDFGHGPEGPFDIVVSNPPYIRSDAIAGLQAGVRDYDPIVALDGGSDGLAAYRSILARAPLILKQGGLLALEVGHDQAADVSALCRAAGFERVAVTPDLAGTGRVVSGTSALSETARNDTKKALGKVEIKG